MVIDLIVQLKHDMQTFKQSRNPFHRLKANRLKKKLMRCINSIFNIELTVDFLKEIPILKGDFPSSELSFLEFSQNRMFINYNPEDIPSRFSIHITDNKIRVTFKKMPEGITMNKFYTNSITPENADIKDRYTNSVILLIKNALVMELFNYIDKI